MAARERKGAVVGARGAEVDADPGGGGGADVLVGAIDGYGDCGLFDGGFARAVGDMLVHVGERGGMVYDIDHVAFDPFEREFWEEGPVSGLRLDAGHREGLDHVFLLWLEVVFVVWFHEIESGSKRSG